MPSKIVYDQVRRGVIITHHGITDGGPFVNICRQITETHSFTKLRYWLNDCTHCTDYRLDAEHIIACIQLTKDHYHRNPKLLVAMVAPDDHSFGIGHLYQVMCGPNYYKTINCHSRSAADTWLTKHLTRRRSRITESDDLLPTG